MGEINFNVKTFETDMFYVNAGWYYYLYDEYAYMISASHIFRKNIFLECIELVYKWLSSQLSITSLKDKFMIVSYQ